MITKIAAIVVRGVQPSAFYPDEASYPGTFGVIKKGINDVAGEAYDKFLKNYYGKAVPRVLPSAIHNNAMNAAKAAVETWRNSPESAWYAIDHKKPAVVAPVENKPVVVLNTNNKKPAKTTPPTTTTTTTTTTKPAKAIETDLDKLKREHAQATKKIQKIKAKYDADMAKLKAKFDQISKTPLDTSKIKIKAPKADTILSMPQVRAVIKQQPAVIKSAPMSLGTKVGLGLTGAGLLGAGAYGAYKLLDNSWES